MFLLAWFQGPAKDQSGCRWETKLVSVIFGGAETGKTFCLNPARQCQRKPATRAVGAARAAAKYRNGDLHQYLRRWLWPGLMRQPVGDRGPAGRIPAPTLFEDSCSG